MANSGWVRAEQPLFWYSIYPIRIPIIYIYISSSYFIYLFIYGKDSGISHRNWCFTSTNSTFTIFWDGIWRVIGGWPRSRWWLKNDVGAASKPHDWFFLHRFSHKYHNFNRHLMIIKPFINIINKRGYHPGKLTHHFGDQQPWRCHHIPRHFTPTALPISI